MLPVLLPAIGAETGRTLSQAGYIVFRLFDRLCGLGAGAGEPLGQRGPAAGAGVRAVPARRFGARDRVRAGLCDDRHRRERCWRAGRCCSPRCRRRRRWRSRRRSGEGGRCRPCSPAGRWRSSWVGRWGAGRAAVRLAGRPTCSLRSLALTASTIIWLAVACRASPGERRTLRERLAVLGNPGVPAALTMGVLFTIGGFAVVDLCLRGHGRVDAAQHRDHAAAAARERPRRGRRRDRGWAHHRPAWALSHLRAARGDRDADAGRDLGAAAAAGHCGWAAVAAAVRRLRDFSGWAMYAAQMGILAVLAPQGVPLAVSLSLSAANVGAALAALIGGWVLDHFGAGSLGIAGARVHAGGACRRARQPADASRPSR